jgi:predicted esterase YcpF (UPF0227 family)
VPRSSPEARRVENRLAGVDTNPYLVIAASLACGYLGIRERLQPSAPLTGSAYEQPHQLPRHLDELRAIEVAAITRPERYLLVAATGDELLDWREMVAAYPGARHRVIEGGDHGLSDFAAHLDEVLAFAGIADPG